MRQVWHVSQLILTYMNSTLLNTIIYVLIYAHIRPCEHNSYATVDAHIAHIWAQTPLLWHNLKSVQVSLFSYLLQLACES